MASLYTHVCAKCRTQMQIVQTGAVIEEVLEDGSPYKLWHCDVFQCLTCNSSVIANFPLRPIAEHFDSDYTRLAKKAVMRFGDRRTPMRVSQRPPVSRESGVSFHE